MGIFSKIKAKAASILFAKYAKKFISDFGDLDTLKIDPVNKNIYLSVNLKGESKSIAITLSGYDVVRSKDGNYILFQTITTSREWINVGLEKFYLEKRIDIPEQYIGIVKFLL
ncbi:MAG: hypothetical protein WCS69_13525 [Ignavibacteriaceae bacterium]